jgi:hypothetical protein
LPLREPVARTTRVNLEAVAFVACRRLARDVAGTLGPLLVLALLVLVALGPALGPLARELGADDAHACACGMKPGTCGCPACARLLGQDDPGRLPERVAVLGACDDHGQGHLFTPLPLGLVPPGAVVAVSPRGGVLLSLSRSTWVPSEGDAPPTPPPRRLSV